MQQTWRMQGKVKGEEGKESGEKIHFLDPCRNVGSTMQSDHAC